jgi:hypothetical protein
MLDAKARSASASRPRSHSAAPSLIRVAQDWKLLAAAINLARFAALGLRSTAGGWQLQRA